MSLPDAPPGPRPLELSPLSVGPRRSVGAPRLLAGWIAVTLWAGIFVAVIGGVGGSASGSAGRDGTAADVARLRNASTAIQQVPMRQHTAMQISSDDDRFSDGGPTAFEMTLVSDGAGATRVDYLVAGRATTMYFDHDHAYLPTLDGTGWLGFHLTDYDDLVAAQEELFGNNTMSFLNQIAGPDQITILGEEQIDGIVTTHYRAVIDLGSLLDANESLTGSTLPDEADALLAMMPDATMDVWLDDAGIPRQLDYEQSFGPMDMRMRTTTSDVGVPVSIDIPGPDQLVGLSDATLRDPGSPFLQHLALLLGGG